MADDPRSQVTTKKGDGGKTTTIAGVEIPKSHPILECCGQIDALRSYTALCRLDLLASGRPGAESIGEFLRWVLHIYFLIGSQCNDPEDRKPEYRRIDVGPEHLARLESFQAGLEREVKLPRQFILSASNPIAARLDYACTLARHAERAAVRLGEAVPAFNGQHILAFLNRLSDTLFMLARRLDEGNYLTVDYDAIGPVTPRTSARGAPK